MKLSWQLHLPVIIVLAVCNSSYTHRGFSCLPVQWSKSWILTLAGEQQFYVKMKMKHAVAILYRVLFVSLHSFEGLQNLVRLTFKDSSVMVLTVKSTVKHPYVCVQFKNLNISYGTNLFYLFFRYVLSLCILAISNLPCECTSTFITAFQTYSVLVYIIQYVYCIAY